MLCVSSGKVAYFLVLITIAYIEYIIMCPICLSKNLFSSGINNKVMKPFCWFLGLKHRYLDQDLVVGDIENCPYSREPTYVCGYDDSCLDFQKLEEKLLNR